MPQPNLKHLKFESLAKLDSGKLETLLINQLKAIANDCMDRPGEKKKREVQVIFKAEPVLSPELECEDVKLSVHVKSKIPEYHSKEYQMKPTKGGFLFNDDFPTELDQTALFPGEDDPED